MPSHLRVPCHLKRSFRPVGVRGFSPLGPRAAKQWLRWLSLSHSQKRIPPSECACKKGVIKLCLPLFLSLSEAAEVSALIASLESKLQEGEDFAFFHSIKWTHKCHIPNMSVLPLGTNYSRMTSTAPSGGGYFLSPKMPRCLH